MHPTIGRARVRSKTFTTEAAARQFRASVTHALATGIYIDPQAGRVTFSDVADQRLASAATSGIRSPNGGEVPAEPRELRGARVR